MVTLTSYNEWRSNWGFRQFNEPGSPSSWGHRKFLGKTLRKIIKIVATRWRILRLKCIKFDFGWGSTPDPAGGAYSAPPDPLAGFGGRFVSGGRGRAGEEEGKWREGKWKCEKGRAPSYCWTRAPQSLATPLRITHQNSERNTTVHYLHI